MKLAVAALVAAMLAPAGAGAQGSATATDCPHALEMSQRHLLGLWRAQFEGLPGASLLLEKHPELTESVRGQIDRNGDRAWLAGDVGDGEFTLEESVNGVDISAAWTGDVVEGSCGREIRGTWQREGDQRQVPFVLRKADGATAPGRTPP
jgi:hypothetical protein